MIFLRLLALQLGLFVFTTGCVSIDGGAVEARWVLRNSRGIAVNCRDDVARISEIAFSLAPDTAGGQTVDPCAEEPACRFQCTRGVGTTPFIIPEGRYAISLQPIDEAGQPLGLTEGVVVPAAVLRDVRLGQLTNLNVNLLIVDR